MIRLWWDWEREAEENLYHSTTMKSHPEIPFDSKKSHPFQFSEHSIIAELDPNEDSSTIMQTLGSSSHAQRDCTIVIVYHWVPILTAKRWYAEYTTDELATYTEMAAEPASKLYFHTNNSMHFHSWVILIPICFSSAKFVAQVNSMWNDSNYLPLVGRVEAILDRGKQCMHFWHVEEQLKQYFAGREKMLEIWTGSVCWTLCCHWVFWGLFSNSATWIRSDLTHHITHQHHPELLIKYRSPWQAIVALQQILQNW